MTDEELYQAIKRIVQEKRTHPEAEQPNFAAKYLEQQLEKKKLAPTSNKIKMNYLMKNFGHLDTYVNLPDLLKTIRKVNIQD